MEESTKLKVLERWFGLKVGKMYYGINNGSGEREFNLGIFSGFTSGGLPVFLLHVEEEGGRRLVKEHIVKSVYEVSENNIDLGGGPVFGFNNPENGVPPYLSAGIYQGLVKRIDELKELEAMGS